MRSAPRRQPQHEPENQRGYSSPTECLSACRTWTLDKPSFSSRTGTSVHYTPITNHTSRKIEANCKATALWWALSPQMAGRDELCGTVFFTGGVDEDGDRSTSATRDRRSVGRHRRVAKRVATSSLPIELTDRTKILPAQLTLP